MLYVNVTLLLLISGVYKHIRATQVRMCRGENSIGGRPAGATWQGGKQGGSGAIGRGRGGRRAVIGEIRVANVSPMQCGVRMSRGEHSGSAARLEFADW